MLNIIIYFTFHILCARVRQQPAQSLQQLVNDGLLNIAADSSDSSQCSCVCCDGSHKVRSHLTSAAWTSLAFCCPRIIRLLTSWRWSSIGAYMDLRLLIWPTRVARFFLSLSVNHARKLAQSRPISIFVCSPKVAQNKQPGDKIKHYQQSSLCVGR